MIPRQDFTNYQIIQIPCYFPGYQESAWFAEPDRCERLRQVHLYWAELIGLHPARTVLLC
jgi:hypothetical protein